MNSKEFVQAFRKIKVSDFCIKHNIDISNLYKGTTKLENYDIIKKEIENAIAKLYLLNEE